MEHARKVLQALLGSKEHPDFKKRLGRWARQLLRDKVEPLIAAARKECAGTARAEAVEKELGYFVRNVARMQYGTFRSRGFFIGSGVIEAGCKTIIGARCKQSGMFWGVLPERKISWLCAASALAVGSTISGNRGLTPTPPGMIA